MHEETMRKDHETSVDEAAPSHVASRFFALNDASVVLFFFAKPTADVHSCRTIDTFVQRIRAAKPCGVGHFPEHCIPRHEVL